MHTSGNRVRWAAALAVLAGGAAWAGTIYHDVPQPGGPDPQQLRALAGRLRAAAPATVPPLAAARTLSDEPATVTIRSATPDSPRRSAVIRGPRTPSNPPPVLPAAAPSRPHSEVAAATTRLAALDPVKSLALLGITRQNDQERAWIVDLLHYPGPRPEAPHARRAGRRAGP